MGCSNPAHTHKWPKRGRLIIQRCERFCNFCPPPPPGEKPKKHQYAWFLRRHVRGIHCGKTHPGLSVADEWTKERDDAAREGSLVSAPRGTASSRAASSRPIKSKSTAPRSTKNRRSSAKPPSPVRAKTAIKKQRSVRFETPSLVAKGAKSPSPVQAKTPIEQQPLPKSKPHSPIQEAPSLVSSGSEAAGQTLSPQGLAHPFDSLKSLEILPSAAQIESKSAFGSIVKWGNACGSGEMDFDDDSTSSEPMPTSDVDPQLLNSVMTKISGVYSTMCNEGLETFDLLACLAQHALYAPITHTVPRESDCSLKEKHEAKHVEGIRNLVANPDFFLHPDPGYHANADGSLNVANDDVKYDSAADVDGTSESDTEMKMG